MMLTRTASLWCTNAVPVSVAICVYVRANCVQQYAREKSEDGCRLGELLPTSLVSLRVLKISRFGYVWSCMGADRYSYIRVGLGAEVHSLLHTFCVPVDAPCSETPKRTAPSFADATV